MMAQLNGRVLVTGAGGFIGSHLVERLLSEDCEVIAMVRYGSLGSIGWLREAQKQGSKKLKIIFGDIRDRTFVEKATAGVDAVFHLAALISIPYSYEASESYVDTNVRGALNVLEACRKNQVKRVVFTSTSEVYGTAQFVPMTEAHPLNAQSPYAATKTASDQLALSYHKSFELPVVVLRPFNCFGPRQSTRAVIPTLISQIASQNSKILVGALTPTRDFTFVKDTAEAFVQAALSERAVGHVINAGSGFEVSIAELIQRLQFIAGTKLPVESEEARIRPENSEVQRLFSDSSLAESLLKWKPRRSLDAGLKETLEWFSKSENLSYYSAGYRV